MKHKSAVLFVKINLDDVLGDSKYTGAYLKMYQKVFKVIQREKGREEVVQTIDDMIDELEHIMDRL